MVRVSQLSDSGFNKAPSVEGYTDDISPSVNPPLESTGMCFQAEPLAVIFVVRCVYLWNRMSVSLLSIPTPKGDQLKDCSLPNLLLRERKTRPSE